MNQIRIFDDLKASPTVLPSRAILAAMAQPEAVTPDLLALLDEVLANPAAFLEEQDHYGHLYALLLLAQFRVPEALPRALALLRLPETEAEWLLGDFLTEAMASVLASLALADPAPLVAAALDRELDPFARAAAMDALLVQGFQDILSPDQTLRTFDGLLAAFEARGAAEDPIAWALLVGTLATGGFQPFQARLEAAFDQGWVDTEIILRGHIAEDLHTNQAHNRRRFLRRTHLVEDALLELEALPWLFADEDELEGEDLADAPPPLSAETRRTILAAQGPPSGQPGRNAPCPCGSGKKFMRCCGKG